MKRIGAIIAILVLLGTFFGHASAQEFQIQGNRIIDPQGRPFIVKGIASPYGALFGGMKDWDSMNTLDRDDDIIKGLGCNFVRVFVAYRPDTLDTDLPKIIDVVAKARARGFVVEIANGNTSFEKNMTIPVKDQPNWMSWLANQWKSDPYVWIEPVNEPRYDPAKGDPRVAWQQEENQYIAAIRKAGDTAPLIVNGPGFSWDLARIEGYPLTDPLNKIIYGAHRYANNQTTFTDKDKAQCDAAWGSMAARLPVIVDEVGGEDTSFPMHLDWNRGFMSYCVDWVTHRQGCGVVAFNWYWCDGNSMSGNARQRLNSGELNAWGKIFRDGYLNQVSASN